jgi:TPR repeat protein
LMYRTGEGVPQDYAEVVWWLRVAAEQGEAQAQYNLGVMYESGSGVRGDYTEAHMWFNLSGSRATGNLRERAAAGRDTIARRMTPAQLAEARRMAREWQEAFERRQR